jgi:hypothetical protein
VGVERRPGGREGRNLPLSLNLREVASRRRIKMRKRGRGNSPSPLFALRRRPLTGRPLQPISGDLHWRVPAKTTLDGYQGIIRSTTIVWSRAGIF